MALPKIIAHRGVGDPWTRELVLGENTIPAIQWAAKNGADGVEGDIQVSGKSASGSRTMYMIHDPDLDRTTNGSGDTNVRNWAYISGLWVEIPRDLDGNGNYDNLNVRVPTYRAWLKAAKATGKEIYLELKGDLWTEAQVRKALDEAKAQGVLDRIVWSGGTTKLGYVKKYGGTKRALSLNDKPSINFIKTHVGNTGYGAISLAEAEESPTYIRNVIASASRSSSTRSTTRRTTRERSRWLPSSAGCVITPPTPNRGRIAQTTLAL